jgi:hypothetical protein
VGLNFADDAEAALFQKIVEDKLSERRQRRERRGNVKRHSLGNGATKSDAPPPPSSTGIAVINGGGYSAPAAQTSMLPATHQPAHMYFSQELIS